MLGYTTNQWQPCSQHQIELHIEIKQLAIDSWSGIFMSAASVAWGQAFGPCQTSATCTCPAAQHPAPVGCRIPAVTSSVSTLRWEQRLAAGCSNAYGSCTEQLLSRMHGVSTGSREVMCPAGNLRLIQIAGGSHRRVLVQQVGVLRATPPPKVLDLHWYSHMSTLYCEPTQA